MAEYYTVSETIMVDGAVAHAKGQRVDKATYDRLSKMGHKDSLVSATSKAGRKARGDKDDTLDTPPLEKAEDTPSEQNKDE